MQLLTKGLCALVFTALCAPPPLEQSDSHVLTQDNDAYRPGLQLDTQLTTASVQSNFGLQFTRTFPVKPVGSFNAVLTWLGFRERTYAQPLVDDMVPNGKAIVIVATDFNNLYAFDAVDPNVTAPLWSITSSILGRPELVLTVMKDQNCSNSLPLVGVLGTPVIQRPNPTIYVQHHVFA